MKIVMITPDSYMIDRRILLEAKTMVNAGHSVTLLAGFECEKEEHYNWEGIEIHRYQYDWDDERLKKIRSYLPNNDRVKMFVNKAFMKIARSILEIDPFDQFMLTKLLELDADVYHVHDLPCLKVGVHAAARKGVPLVYDAHELYYAQEVLPKTLQRKYYELEKKYIQQPTVSITVNPFIAQLMEERYQVKRPEVIMNCTEKPVNFNPDKSRTLLCEKSGIPEDWNIVLYQGWISPERNLETIVRGVRFFPEKTALAIIGYGEYEKVLREVAIQENIQDRIFFLGKVPSEEMLHFSAGADIGIIPYRPIDDNHLYCSPNKLFEYVLAGVPIIADDLPFFNLMQEKYGFIQVTNMGSSSAFGQTVCEMLKDVDRKNDLKAKCNAAATELNWEVEGQKLLHIYNTKVFKN
ncbi:glycosyltransferase [Brevibacillus porteri]|uniref:glycosyltransferase n=1 Tax=Brevibacillus TaxID=55080 RepID=UPI00352F6C60